MSAAASRPLVTVHMEKTTEKQRACPHAVMLTVTHFLLRPQTHAHTPTSISHICFRLTVYAVLLRDILQSRFLPLDTHTYTNTH